MAPMYLTENDAARLSRLLLAWESGRLNPLIGSSGSDNPPPIESYLGQLTSDCPGMTGTVAGSTTVSLMSLATGTLAAGTAPTAMVYNLTSTSISSGTTVPMVREPLSGNYIALPPSSGSTTSFVGCSLTNSAMTMNAGYINYISFVSPTGAAYYDTSGFLVGTGVEAPQAGFYFITCRINYGQLASTNAGSCSVAVTNFTRSYSVDFVQVPWNTTTTLGVTQVNAMPQVCGIGYFGAGDVVAVEGVPYREYGSTYSLPAGNVTFTMSKIG